jgi:hypothetical protein
MEVLRLNLNATGGARSARRISFTKMLYFLCEPFAIKDNLRYKTFDVINMKVVLSTKKVKTDHEPAKCGPFAIEVCSLFFMAR